MSLRRIAAVATLSNAAVAWLFVGLFEGTPNRTAIMFLTLVGVVVGAVAVRVPSIPLRLLATLLPVGLVVTAAATSAPDGLKRAVIDAVGSGQLTQPPIQFGAAWQLIIGTLLVALGAASVNLAAAKQSARYAALLPLPVVAGLTLIQPPGTEMVAVMPAVVLSLIALALAQGDQELGDQESGASGFELNRVMRAGAMIVVVAGLLTGLTMVTNVLPENAEESPQPPKPPQAAAAVRGNAPLFQVRSADPVPLRLGVLDNYRDSQWMTPRQDPSQFAALGSGSLSDSTPRAEDVRSATVTVGRPDTGRFVPQIPGTYQIQGLPSETAQTPGALRLPIAGERGLTYTMRFVIMTEKRYAGLKLQPADTTALPEAPPSVQTLLNQAPAADDLPARIRYVRGAFFDAVKEGPPAPPAPVSPARVEEILAGNPASPYELSAAEALIIEWAGAKARVAYGYLQRTKDATGAYPITPESGASWAEVRVDGDSGDEGSGEQWIALTDRPSRANTGKKTVTKAVVMPNGQRIAELAVPVQVDSGGLIQVVVRYWLMRYAIIAALAGMLWLGLPGVLRGVRHLRRRRWAEQRGRAAQIAVAYARLRDKAIDLEVGTPEMTPLEFLDALTPDPDHVEFAWLVDRALFGDLQRDLTDLDTRAAEAMSRALTTRLSQGQSYFRRIASFGSHRSLRQPWSADLPNAYPNLWLKVAPHGWQRWHKIVGAALAVALSVGIPAAVGIKRVDIESASTLAPLPQVPAKVMDVSYASLPEATTQFDKRKTRALIGAAGMYSVNVDAQPVGTLQTSAFKIGLADDNYTVRSGVLKQLGMTDVRRVGSEVFYTRRLGDLSVALWFSRDGQTFQVLTSAPDLKDPLATFARLVATQSGLDPTQVADITKVAPIDVRQWSNR